MDAQGQWNGRLIGSSAHLKEVRALIERFGPTDDSALIMGETGVGKELVARALHGAGPRSAGPFVVSDCNITDSVAEAQLFGIIANFPGFHERNGLVGRFEQAHGGTLFLDEVGDLPLSLQSRLLRVLQFKEALPVGAEKPRRIDVRLIAATNQDLIAAVREGRFRLDLFHRLARLPICIKPLRERRDDIPDLIAHFMSAFQRQYRKPVERLSESAMTRLLTHKWPGNVRELENVLAQAFVLCDGAVIEEEHLRMFPAMWTATDPSWNSLSSFDRIARRFASERIHRLTRICEDVRAAGGRMELKALRALHVNGHIGPKQFSRDIKDLEDGGFIRIQGRRPQEVCEALPSEGEDE